MRNQKSRTAVNKNKEKLISLKKIQLIYLKSIDQASKNKSSKPAKKRKDALITTLEKIGKILS